MKNQKKILGFISILLALFIVASVLIFYNSNNEIEQGYLASEGNAAENFAVLAAQNIKLSDEDVARLKNMSYSSLLKSEENNKLKDMLDDDNFTSKVDYAYIMIHLDDNEVKYVVDKSNEERYDAPLDTKLDIMWLLDVNVSDDANENNMNSGVKEIQRYSYYIEEDAKIFGEQPTYIYNSSEWGDHICGYSPIYTTEGKYIGALGIELQTADYNTYRKKAIYAMGTLMTVSILMLTAIYAYVYRKYRKIHFDRMYTDPLTQIGNRSYYDDRFIKKMKSRKVSGKKFALIIFDIDWFKKVNDTFGHNIGDEVLVEIGEILLETFGKEYSVRFGGEEFIIGQWVKDEEELKSKIDVLFDKINKHRFSRKELTISVSLGCCYCDDSDITGWLIASMLKTADSKLYESKENGRKQYRIIKYEDSNQLEQNN